MGSGASGAARTDLLVVALGGPARTDLFEAALGGAQETHAVGGGIASQYENTHSFLKKMMENILATQAVLRTTANSANAKLFFPITTKYLFM